MLEFDKMYSVSAFIYQAYFQCSAQLMSDPGREILLEQVVRAEGFPVS